MSQAPLQKAVEPESLRQQEEEKWRLMNDAGTEEYLPPEKLAKKIATGALPDRFVMPTENLKNTIHLVAQSKGGSGKTFVASTLAGFFARHVPDLSLYCFDLDSNKRSFAAFQAFNVMQISEIGSHKGEIVIDPSRFDKAFNSVLEEIDEDAIVVMDTGAGTSFWSLVRYLSDLDYPALCRSCGDREWRFIIDVVVSGNAVQESKDTIERLRKYMDSPFVEYIIWGNEYFGYLDKVYDEIIAEYGDMFKRSVNLPMVTNNTLNKLLRFMRENNLSASEMFMCDSLTKIQKTYITQYYYGNDGGKSGVFRALQNLDWSPKAQLG